MKSLQTHLISWLAVAMVTLSIVSGGSLLLWLRHTLLQEFDQSLLLRAQELQSLVSSLPDGSLDIDINAPSLGGFSGPGATDYFALEDLAGKRISASSPASILIAARPAAGAWNSRLASGRPARAIQLVFQPPLESSDGSRRPADRPVSLKLTVARDRTSLDRVLLRLTLGILLATAVFSAVAVGAAVGIVRRGLKTLRRVAGDVASVDFRQSGAAFSDAHLPQELIPIVQRLNELLERVSQAFARERRFTAAVSHELRTPLSELRSAADLAVREPTDLPLNHRAALQSQEIAIQMQTMVATLLSITTHERSAEDIAIEDVPLGDIILRALSRNSAALSSRGITIEDKVAQECWVVANRPLLNAVLDNLIDNAARYAKPGTAVVVTGTIERQDVQLLLCNEQEQLSADDVAHVFEPFWRKDKARSEGQHVGLGMTLVRAYCQAMGIQIDATLDAGGRFLVTLVLRQSQIEPAVPRELENLMGISGHG